MRSARQKAISTARRPVQKGESGLAGREPTNLRAHLPRPQLYPYSPRWSPLHAVLSRLPSLSPPLTATTLTVSPRTEVLPQHQTPFHHQPGRANFILCVFADCHLLEDYLNEQLADNTYDLIANLALLKLYQVSIQPRLHAPSCHSPPGYPPILPSNSRLTNLIPFAVQPFASFALRLSLLPAPRPCPRSLLSRLLPVLVTPFRLVRNRRSPPPSSSRL